VIRIVREGVERLAEYATVPITFEVSSKLSLPALKIGRFVEDAVEPFVKDYDAVESERPTSLPDRLGHDHLVVLAAYKNDSRVGGAILHFPSEVEAQLIDLRIHPESRRSGLGRRLVQSALAEVAHRGIPTMEIETQDTNVAACRFYHSLGASLVWIEPNGYPGFSDEAKLVWSLPSEV
jgi:ribosomal protein S18 acetylase RimI-like enzyme